MTEKIALLVDSGSDVPTSIIENYDNIEIAPLLLQINENEYRDRENIQPDEFYEIILQSSPQLKTSSPTMGTVLEKVEKLKNDGYTHIIGITVSSGLSVTNQVFSNVAADQNDITMKVIDTKSVGIGSGLFAVSAEEMIANQLPFEEIVKNLEKAIKKSSVYFYIPTLKYLAAGGRIGKVAGILGTALKIKPVITCNDDGIYYPIAKSRTEEKALSKMLDLVINDIDSSKKVHVGIAEGYNQPLLKKVHTYLKERYPERVFFTGNVSPALGVHTGPGLIGIAVKVDE